MRIREWSSDVCSSDLTALAIAPGERHVDGTFGAGGYSAAMVDHGAPVFALDRDPDAIAEGHALVAAKGGALTLIEGRCSGMELLVKEVGVHSALVVTLGSERRGGGQECGRTGRCR